MPVHVPHCCTLLPASCSHLGQGQGGVDHEGGFQLRRSRAARRSLPSQCSAVREVQRLQASRCLGSLTLYRPHAGSSCCSCSLPTRQCSAAQIRALEQEGESVTFNALCMRAHLRSAGCAAITPVLPCCMGVGERVVCVFVWRVDTTTPQSHAAIACCLGTRPLTTSYSFMRAAWGW